MENITKNAVNAIRVLSMDGVQQANSGHPGLPLGAAPMAYELWAHHLKHNPKNPQWTNRDRFILSAGHGSMLIYSLLHLFGYDLPIEELKNFRQWNSKTPGHPEFRHTVGVETTTGPLGAGLSNAVGMAMAEAHLASIFNRPGYPVVDHYTYAIAGDGCMMEGVASEAMSLAGHLGLGKLIVLYDSNRITIEGSTDLAFSENVEKRFESYGFQVIEVADGNRLSKIARAIEQAKEESDRPTLITIKTEIGFGSPKQGSEKAHGEPLGLENITKTRQTLEWDESEPFKISDEIYAHFDQLALRGDAQEKEHQTLVENYRKEYPELAKLWEEYNRDIPLEELVNNESYWEHEDKAIATRSISGTILNKLKEDYPQLIGGSADLAPSTKTEMVNEGSFQKESYEGRNIHFGVREHAMAGVGNGIVTHGGLKSYVSTFFVFTDFLKPALRLSALSQVPLIYIMTHDSIVVGEDGPTHQPIEQLATIRSQPNTHVFRPADYTETMASWALALSDTRTPSVLVLSRQNLPNLKQSSKEALKGGYIISKEQGTDFDGILLASGSEVSLAIEAQGELLKQGIDVRVVSMLSMEVFNAQDAAYRESVLPNDKRKRLAIEAGASQPWFQYIGLDGKHITIDRFGHSAPGEKVYEEYGFTVENVVKVYTE